MNKTSIEWTDLTWNPVTGCTKRCAYCYANRLAQGRLRKLYLANPNVAPGCEPDDPFSPRLWAKRFAQPLLRDKPAKIFTVDMGDLFDPHVPTRWIQAVLTTAESAHWHTFQFLTKQPQRAAEYHFPPNAWVGITVDSVKNNYWGRLYGLLLINAPIRFISYEPLLTPVKHIPEYVDWIIIGAMTGPVKFQPKREWVQNLIDIADNMQIPVFLKDNLHWPEVRREWPKTRKDGGAG